MNDDTFVSLSFITKDEYNAWARYINSPEIKEIKSDLTDLHVETFKLWQAVVYLESDLPEYCRFYARLKSFSFNLKNRYKLAIHGFKQCFGSDKFAECMFCKYMTTTEMDIRSIIQFHSLVQKKCVYSEKFHQFY